MSEQCNKATVFSYTVKETALTTTALVAATPNPFHNCLWRHASRTLHLCAI